MPRNQLHPATSIPAELGTSRQRCAKILAVAATISLLSASALPTRIPCEQALVSITSMLHHRRLEQALALTEHAIVQCGAQFGEHDVSRTLLAQVKLAHIHNGFRDAERGKALALSVLERLSGEGRATDIVRAEALHVLASAYLRLDQDDKARAIGEESIQILRRYSDAPIRLKARALANLAFGATSQYRSHEAIKLLDEARATYPPGMAPTPRFDVELLRVRAWALRLLGRPGEAAQVLSVALEGIADNPEVWEQQAGRLLSNMATAMVADARPGEAVIALQKATSHLIPGSQQHLTVLTTLARLEMEAGNFQQARDSLYQMGELACLSASYAISCLHASINRAIVDLTDGKPHEAARYLEEAERKLALMDPQPVTPPVNLYLEKAAVARHLNDDAAVQAAFEKAEHYLKRVPSGRAAHANHAIAELRYWTAKGDEKMARRAAQRTLSLLETAGGPDSPRYAIASGYKGIMQYQSGNLDAALPLLQQAEEQLSKHTERSSGSEGATRFVWSERRAILSTLQDDLLVIRNALANVLFDLHSEQSDSDRYLQLAFSLLQRRDFGSIQPIVATIDVARSSDDTLAALIGEHRKLLREDLALEQRLVQLPRPPHMGAADYAQITGELGTRVAQIREELATLVEQITAVNPRYQQYFVPMPLRVAQVQRGLADDEGMVIFDTYGNDIVYGWFLTTNGLAWTRLEINKRELQGLLARIRLSLQPPSVASGIMQSTGPLDRYGLPIFDVEASHELFRRLLHPLWQSIDEPVPRHLNFVGSMMFESISPAILITDVPDSFDASAPDYRQVGWLGLKHAITLIPGISLHHEHVSASSRSNDSLSGPVFAAFANPNYGSALPALAHSETEAREIGELFKANDDHLFFGPEASEEKLKSVLRESAYPILLIATHTQTFTLGNATFPAFRMGDSKGDDGLLTLAEIAELPLTTDWVLLSACNTGLLASADYLTSFQAAFYLAGARSLLVSMWPLEDQAAAFLTAETVRQATLNPAIGRSEALRRAMNLLAANETRGFFSHPAVFGSLVNAGYGGPLRLR